MIRKQIFLGAHQNESLKRLALRTGRSEAAIIREALDAQLAAAAQSEAQWTELLAQWKARGAAGAARSWTRESLYEERLGKYDDPR